MPRGRAVSSGRSDSSDVDLEGIAEGELTKLQRKFRLKEGDRQAYSIESQDVIRRQLAEMQALDRERQELLINLDVAESRRNQARDHESRESLSNLLEQKDDVEEQLAREKELIADLEEEIRIWEKKLSEQRKAVGGSAGSLRRSAHTHKSIRVMENRLDRALTKFNSQLAKNSSMREELDIMRIEKTRFEQLHRKLEKELHETRKEIGAVIDDSSSAYDARDEAQTKMLQLKEKTEKDLAQHTAEIKELQRIIDHDRKLKEFMNTKTHERSISEEVLEARRRREKEESERKRRDPTEETVETYEAAFQQIRSITSEDNLDILVSKFIEVEDRNFALFNYVNEQNNETERLLDQIAEIKKEIEDFKAQGVRLDQEHKMILRELERKHEEATRQANSYQEQLKGVMKVLDQLKTGIDILFAKINCDRSVLNAMLGSSSNIRDNNIMQYLGLIEQKTNEILACQSYLDSKNYDKPYDPHETALLLLGQMTDFQSPSLQILPPSTGDEYDSDMDSPLAEEEERPLTQSELRERIMRGVLKKEERASKKGNLNETALSKTGLVSTSRRRQAEA
ncbi:outer dynein arm-docking complex subunit 1 [Ambystoma mexicanum]|uniref:outer dynein arm-docking complex subunit 1 n=1 Tax=Ambystoma mexicanum TaxID=8296 RepID=UPI0037E865BA